MDGMRLAVDDVGAGYSSILRVLDLRPDLLKVDRALIQGCATDPMRRYVLEFIVALASKQGGESSPRAWSSQTTLRVVHEIGIDYVQGFLLGRPGPGPTGLIEEHQHQLRAIGPQPTIEVDSAVPATS